MAIQRWDPWVAEAATRALLTNRPPASVVDWLASRGLAGEPELEAAAIQILAGLGQRGSLTAIRQRAPDANARVRRAAAGGLAAMDPRRSFWALGALGGDGGIGRALDREFSHGALYAGLK